MNFLDFVKMYEQGTTSISPMGGPSASGRLGESPNKPGKPQTNPINPSKIPQSMLSPSDSLPPGWKPKNPPGINNPGPGYIKKPGWMGSGLGINLPSPKGGSFGSGGWGTKSSK